MYSVIPVLANAAAVGALIGGAIGLAYETRFDAKVTSVIIGAVAAIALRSIALFFSVGTAVGVSIAAFLYLKSLHDRKDDAVVHVVKLLGCMVIGGSLGYIAQPLLAGVNWSVLA